MAVLFSPKILGLNVGMIGIVFRQSGIEFRIVIGPCVLFYVLLLEK